MNIMIYFVCTVNDVNGRFNFVATLARIASDTADLDRMRKQAETDSERNVLQFYNVSLPPVSVPSVDGLCMNEASVLLQASSRACALSSPSNCAVCCAVVRSVFSDTRVVTRDSRLTD